MIKAHIGSRLSASIGDALIGVFVGRVSVLTARALSRAAQHGCSRAARVRTATLEVVKWVRWLGCGWPSWAGWVRHRFARCCWLILAQRSFASTVHRRSGGACCWRSGSRPLWWLGTARVRPGDRRGDGRRCRHPDEHVLWSAQLGALAGPAGVQFARRRFSRGSGRPRRRSCSSSHQRMRPAPGIGRRLTRQQRRCARRPLIATGSSSADCHGARDAVRDRPVRRWRWSFAVG